MTRTDPDIMAMYEQYHSEAIENAFRDIDAMLAEKKVRPETVKRA